MSSTAQPFPMPLVDILIPFRLFDELNLEKLHQFHQELNLKSNHRFHWILIQDQFENETKQLEIKSKINALKIPIDVYFHNSNKGKGAAIQTGLKYSSGDFVIYTDADLTYPVSVILEFIKKISSFDIVLGNRIKTSSKERPFKRRLLSDIMSWFNYYIWALPIRDSQCGIKMFKKEHKPILEKIGCKRYLFDWEFLMRSEQAQLTTGIVEVTPFEHTDSNISNMTLLQEMISFLKTFYFPLLTFLIISILMSELINESFVEIAPNEFAIRSYIASDFDSHVHQINHMSNVDPWPGVYPLHCGEPNRYHFFYYKIVSIIHNFGFSINTAINGLSIVSWIGLLFFLSYLSWLFTGSLFITGLTPLLIYFNSSLNFLNLINSFSSLTFKKLWNDFFYHNNFLAFAPYDQGDIAAFWSLHVYLNQRHFIFGLFLLFFAILILLQKNRNKIHQFIVIGLVTPLLYALHRPCLIGLALFLLFQFFLPSFDKSRKKFLYLGLFALLLIGTVSQFLTTPLTFKPFYKFGYLWGYLNGRPWYDIFIYWFKNLGLFLPLLFIGYFKSTNFIKKSTLSFFALFIITNTIQFAREMAGNHKFLNIFVLGTIPIALIGLHWIIKKTHYLFMPILLFLICIGGILDQRMLWTSSYIFVPDREQQPLIHYLKNHNDKGCIITNSLYYNPATWSGHPLYLGWPYFAWGLGYNTEQRTRKLYKLMEAPNKEEICQFAKTENLHWLIIQKNKQSNAILPPADPLEYDNLLEPQIVSPLGNYHLYHLFSQCRKIHRKY